MRGLVVLREDGMRRELGQLSLADGLVDGGAGRNRQLERIAALVWAAFERLLAELYAAPAVEEKVLQSGKGRLLFGRCRVKVLFGLEGASMTVEGAGSMGQTGC